MKCWVCPPTLISQALLHLCVPYLLAGSQLTYASTCNCNKTVTSSLFAPGDANIKGGDHFSTDCAVQLVEALLPCFKPLIEASPAKQMFSHQASLPICSRLTCTDISNKKPVHESHHMILNTRKSERVQIFTLPHPNIKRRKFSKVWKQIDERQESKFAPCAPKEAILRSLFLSCRHYQEGAG